MHMLNYSVVTGIYVDVQHFIVAQVLYNIIMLLLKKVFFNTSTWFCCMKKKNCLIEDKTERQGVEGTYLLESQEAHHTGEFVVAA